jgi:hypothetical protein
MTNAAAFANGTGDRFLDLQLSFNLFPATYVHSTWLEQIGLAADDACPPGTQASPFWARCLSTALLRAFRLDQQFDFDFFDTGKRLALLDGTELLRLGGLVGAVLMRDRFRLIVERTQVETLRNVIGAEAHRFALQWREQPIGLRRHEPGWISEFEEPLPDAEGWAAYSASLVHAAIPPTADGVQGRLQLKFPRAWSQPTAQGPHAPDMGRAGLATLFFSVIQAEARPWAWLFEEEPPC